MSGRRIGPYRLVRVAGRGPWGEQWEAVDEHGRPALLVQLDGWSELDPTERATAAERLQQARRLDDPRVVRIVAADTDAERPWVALESIGGSGPLGAGPADAARSRTAAVALAASAAECVQVLHDAGIVHGALRPSAFVLDEHGALRVFGAGLVPSQRAVVDDAGPERSPRYLAPEQIRGARVDRRADLFALGAIALELISGRHAFAGDTPASIAYRIVHEPLDPRAIDDSLPGELAAVLARALDRKPDARQGSAAELAAELRQAIGTLADIDSSDRAPAAGSTAGPPTRRPPRARRSTATPFVVVLLLLGVVAAGSLLWRGRPSGDATAARPAPAPALDPASTTGRSGTRDGSWLTTSVRVEPATAEVRLDGLVLDPEAAAALRFRADGPYGTLIAKHECRTVERTIEPSDAGGQIVLVVDPVQIDWRIDPGLPDATVLLNGAAIGRAPLELSVDLCRENQVEIRAAGHLPAAVTIPAGSSPVEARGELLSLRPEPIPRGRIVVPDGNVRLVVYIDGRRQAADSSSFELDAGEYTVRLKNEYHWIDVSHRVRLEGGATIGPEQLPLPKLGTMTVQAYPANCTVEVARRGERARDVGETPFNRSVAVGPYTVRIVWQATGESETRDVEIAPGRNEPVRVAFGQ